MRLKLGASILISCFFAWSAYAQEIDYTKLARKELVQLDKCFSDMLTVVRRHSLRTQLAYFLEAGCAAEMRGYAIAVTPHVVALQGLGLSEETKQQFVAMSAVVPLVEVAQRLYNDQPLSFCGDACPINAYRKCLLLQVSDQLSRHTKPSNFERISQGKCGAQENKARAVLTIEFTEAQKRQANADLSEKTRELINAAITEVLHDVVVSYAEDLRKVDPGRKSCKTPMCGANKCIVLEDEAEYKCSIVN